MDCSHRVGRGIGHGLVLLPTDDEAGRGNTAYEGDCRACAPGRHGISPTAVQGGGHRVHHPCSFVRFHGIRAPCAEPMGAICIPHWRTILRTGRILRHEDCHLCQRTHRQRSAPRSRQGTESGVQKWCGHGTRGGGAWIARHRHLVPHPQLFLSGRQHGAHHHHHHHAHLWNGCVGSGAVRQSGRWNLHQGC